MNNGGKSAVNIFYRGKYIEDAENVIGYHFKRRNTNGA